MHLSRAARLFALAILCAGLSACGGSGADAVRTATTDAGQDSSPTVAAGEKKTPRPSPRGGVTKAALLKKLMSEPDAKDLPESVLSCVAEVSLKYGNANDLKRYVEGSLASEKVRGLTPSNKPYWTASEKCVR